MYNKSHHTSYRPTDLRLPSLRPPMKDRWCGGTRAGLLAVALSLAIHFMHYVPPVDACVIAGQDSGECRCEPRPCAVGQPVACSPLYCMLGRPTYPALRHTARRNPSDFKDFLPFCGKIVGMYRACMPRYDVRFARAGANYLRR